MHESQPVSRRAFLTTSAGALVVPSAFAAAAGKKLVLLAGRPSHGPL